VPFQSEKPKYVVGKWKVAKLGPRKPRHTRPAKPAQPARAPAPLVSFATHAAFEREIDEMYAPSDPIPDYADIYWQPDNSGDDAERERNANTNRRATLAARNKGRFGFHGGADVTPVLRYEGDDYPVYARRGMEQSPTRRAPKDMAPNAYDQPVTSPERRFVVKKNTPVVNERIHDRTQREPKKIVPVGRAEGDYGSVPKPKLSTAKPMELPKRGDPAKAAESLAMKQATDATMKGKARARSRG